MIMPFSFLRKSAKNTMQGSTFGIQSMSNRTTDSQNKLIEKSSSYILPGLEISNIDIEQVVGRSIRQISPQMPLGDFENYKKYLSTPVSYPDVPGSINEITFRFGLSISTFYLSTTSSTLFKFEVLNIQDKNLKMGKDLRSVLCAKFISTLSGADERLLFSYIFLKGELNDPRIIETPEPTNTSELSPSVKSFRLHSNNSPLTSLVFGDRIVFKCEVKNNG